MFTVINGRRRPLSDCFIYTSLAAKALRLRSGIMLCHCGQDKLGFKGRLVVNTKYNRPEKILNSVTK